MPAIVVKTYGRLKQVVVPIALFTKLALSEDEPLANVKCPAADALAAAATAVVVATQEWASLQRTVVPPPQQCCQFSPR